MQIKRIITVALCIIFIALTGNALAQVKKKAVVKKKVAPVAAVVAPPPPPFATAPEIEEGKALLAKADCLACHKLDTKLVGPAYTAVAEKYPQNQTSLDTLTKKIIKGGKGVWGQVPMAPHPLIAPDDAGKMIKYILTLNAKSAPVASK
ncbi:MAG: c-type cytochrome [Bacteroidota bacterium]